VMRTVAEEGKVKAVTRAALSATVAIRIKVSPL
jgi:hypothetical protein